MAITPHEAGKISQSDVRSVDEAEKAIDIKLKTTYQGSGHVRITEPISKLSDRCRKELLRRFRASGWGVTKKHEAGCSDPREYSSGYDYWIFKAEKPINTSFGDQISNPAPPPWRDDGPINPNWR